MVGAPPAASVERLTKKVADLTGKPVGVLEPIRLRALADTDRVVLDERVQLSSSGVMHLVANAYPKLFRDKDIVLIILTGHDIWLDQNPDVPFTFGAAAPAESGHGGWGLISDARIDPRAYGAPEDRSLLDSRMDKLVGRYVGMMFLAMPISSDPKSPTFHGLSSPEEVDDMVPLPGWGVTS